MAVRLSKVGRERNCLLKASQRLVVPSKPIACAPQQNMRAGVARIARQRLACKLGAFGKAAFLTPHHSQVIMRVGIVRLGAPHRCSTKASLSKSAVWGRIY